MQQAPFCEAEADTEEETDDNAFGLQFTILFKVEHVWLGYQSASLGQSPGATLSEQPSKQQAPVAELLEDELELTQEHVPPKTMQVYPLSQEGEQVLQAIVEDEEL